ncbi:MAG: HypC/HybG/HupF family hydrogenase formation chaperone [Planctomycetes bacterium]|nr:HypC/HybG/HupF family hydrogenase formation chaperone [Planctomycetota bacterium]
MCLAIPGKIASITNSQPLTRAGKVDFGGVVKEINLAFVPEADIGDYVIAHVGFAIARVSEAEARRTLGELQGDAR